MSRPTAKPQNKIQLKKIFFVLLFGYFVSMMIVMANGSSFMGRFLVRYYIPVANSIGLNTTWNFFSPDPAHTMFFRYIVHFEDEYGTPTKEPLSLMYPEEGENTDFRIHKRRDSYVARFFVIDSAKLQTFFIPWICKKYPGATKIQTELVLNRIPDLERVLTLAGTNYLDLIQTEEMDQNVYSCP